MMPCGDRDALADALVQLLDDEGLRIQLGTTGRHESHEVHLAARHVAGARRLPRRHGARRRRRMIGAWRPASPSPAWRPTAPATATSGLRPVLNAAAERAGRRRITFDDGPNPDATPLILDVAAATRACTRPSSFSGDTPSDGPRLVRRMADEGHQLGNHGYFHRKLHRRIARVRARRSHARHRSDRARVGRRAAAPLPRAARLSQSLGDADRRLARAAHRRLVARRLGLGAARRRRDRRAHAGWTARRIDPPAARRRRLRSRWRSHADGRGTAAHHRWPATIADFASSTLPA